MDKVEHFFACLFCSLVAYLVLTKYRFSTSFQKRLIVACIISIIFGALKEVGDGLNFWIGNMSLRDFAADCAGAFSGILTIQLFSHPRCRPYLPDFMARHIFGLPQSRSRLIDLEHGVVYGKSLFRQYTFSRLDALKQFLEDKGKGPMSMDPSSFRMSRPDNSLLPV